jgi:thrombospondin type 3 repeat protein
MMLKECKTLLIGIFAALVLLLPPPAAMGAQLSGAIFTTLVDGTSVNHNIYNSKQDVYLNGGPNSPNAPCSAAGLPDGDYYFQVTDPSGKIVLSTDSWKERKVRVIGGIIKYYLGTTHHVGVGKCASVTVGLMPFNDTPNPGGEYKVWMTPVENFKEFLPSRSKTDNFKAPGDAILDSDGDGLTDDYEVNVSRTNPLNPDTDADGLTDDQEVNDTHTDPNKADTDNDGIWDGDEVSMETNPLNPDTDRDGVSDGVETNQGTDPLNPTDFLPPVQ